MNKYFVTWPAQTGFTTAFGSANAASAIVWSGNQFVGIGGTSSCATST